MFKEEIDIKELSAKAIAILDELEGIEDYGYVGNYALSKEDTKKISNEVDDLLDLAITKLEFINKKIVESFEH